MSRWVYILLAISLVGNVAAFFLIRKLWPHRQNAILAWAATEAWVGEQNRKVTRNPSVSNDNKIVLLGASITQGFDQSKYFEDTPFINSGVNGHVSGQYLLRFKQDVIDYHPRVAVIKLCAINFTRNIPVEITRDNVMMMIQLARANGIEPILATTIPITEKFDHQRSPKNITREIEDFNLWLKEYARKNNSAYLDYYAALADERGYLREEYSTDGLHLNEEGYKIMAACLKKLLKSTQ